MAGRNRLLVDGALLVATQDEQLGEISNGQVLIEGDRIAAVGKGIDASGAEVVDASGCVVLPGFVNTHHHFFQVLTRNLPQAQDSKLFDWLVFHYEVWRHLEPEMLYDAASAAAAELLLTGCTLSADHQYLIPKGSGWEFYHAEAEAAERIGMRLLLTRGSMSLGKSRGGLPPDDVVQPEQQILKDSERVIERLHGGNPASMRRVALAPCSPFSVTEDLMKQTAELARGHGVRLHTHLAETKDEERFCLERFGCRPVEYAERLGWLGPDVWFAHCVHLNEQEMDRMASTGTSVAHCPVSNLRLGSGIAPVPAMLDRGVNVGLAVDGSASNDSSNMLRELQVACLVHRVGTGVEAMPARRAVRMATKGGAMALGWPELGVLRPGAVADLAIFKLDRLPYAGALSDPLAALVFCGIEQRAWSVIVGGRRVVDCARLCTEDEQEIFERACRSAERLWRKAQIM